MVYEGGLVRSKLVAGRYATVRELGRGGMGVVWLAEDRVIGRRVALKELRTSSNTDVERVLREARTAGRLNSPAVVTVHDVLSEHGTTYLVMELVEAPTLADLMRRGPLPADRVVAIGLAVLGALETAHAAGVVHRDVKPSNIMVLPDGRVKLADFGIARALDDPALTATGGVMGSPGYLAPELFAGAPPSPASDLWALGATLFHAAEGRSPFQRETTAATLHAIMQGEPVLTRCRGPLATVVRGLLTQSTADRMTAGQVRANLTGLPPRAAEPDTVVMAPVGHRGGDTRLNPVTSGGDTRLNPMTPGGVDTRLNPVTPGGRRSRRVAALVGAGAAVTAVAVVSAFALTPDREPGRASGIAVGDRSSTAPTSAPTTTAPSSAPATTTTPVTTTTTTPQAPPRQTTALTRFRDAAGWHYSGSTLLATPGGYAPEVSLGKLVVDQEPGTAPLYSCQIANSPDRMTSTAANCEGQAVYGLLGHVFAQQPADAPALPIYRCNAGGHHFESLDPACEGHPAEFQLGWVLL
ncbi:serine/threonine-protein kinase [Saccharothrix sp. BKS2]|uniref:serine/threonine-protein kinase n=1 Tax=Saccharothrix sp. BKS2 TaxID=3064400 RepID=UPI0039E7F7F5